MDKENNAIKSDIKEDEIEIKVIALFFKDLSKIALVTEVRFLAGKYNERMKKEIKFKLYFSKFKYKNEPKFNIKIIMNDINPVNMNASENILLSIFFILIK